MPATTTNSTHPLVKKHDELIDRYGKTAGAAKAQVSRQIVECELDMTLEGVAFTSWEKPSSYKTSWTMSEAELREQVGKLRQLVATDGVADVIKAAAERRLQRFEQQAEKRGIEV